MMSLVSELLVNYPGMRSVFPFLNFGAFRSDTIFTKSLYNSPLPGPYPRERRAFLSLFELMLHEVS